MPLVQNAALVVLFACTPLSHGFCNQGNSQLCTGIEHVMQWDPRKGDYLDFDRASIKKCEGVSITDWDMDGNFDLLAPGNEGSIRYFSDVFNFGLDHEVLNYSNPFSAVNLSGMIEYGYVYGYDPMGHDGFEYYDDDDYSYYGYDYEGGGQSTRVFLETVDWDGDGDLDLLIGFQSGSQAGRLAYYEQLADGQLVEKKLAISLPNETTAPLAQAVDWDADGDVDLLIGYGARLLYYERMGDMNLSLREGIDADPFYGIVDGLQVVASEVAPEIADWDGDGDLDLTLGVRYEERCAYCSFSAEYVLIGFFQRQEDGSLFLLRGDMGDPFYYMGYELETPYHKVVDSNMDGIADFLRCADKYGTYIHKYKRKLYSGALLDDRNPFNAVDLGPGCLADLADWDSDADLDLIVGSVGDTGAAFIRLFAQASKGQLQDTEGTPEPFQGIGELEVPDMDGLPYPITKFVQPIAVDWNNDGFLDLAVVTSGGANLYERDASGNLSLRFPNPFNATPCCIRAILDWNHDGKYDLIISNLSAYNLYLQQHDESFILYPADVNPLAHIADSSGFDQLDVFDWNGDGYLDLLQIPFRKFDYERKAFMFKQTSESQFIKEDLDFRFSYIMYDESHVKPLGGDWNGDGYMDLLIVTELGSVGVYTTGKTCTVEHQYTKDERDNTYQVSCRGRGVCDLITQKCTCFEGHLLPDCSRCRKDFFGNLSTGFCTPCPGHGTAQWTCHRRGHCVDDTMAKTLSLGSEARTNTSNRLLRGNGTCLCSPYFYSENCGMGECPAAFEQAADMVTGVFACHRCTPGRTKANAGDLPCSECPTGTFWDNRTALCPCEAGKFASNALMSFCESCPAGKFSERSALVCLNCSIGRYSETESATACADCKQGHYQNKAGTTFCERCTFGKYSSASNAAWCDSCPGPQDLMTTLRDVSEGSDSPSWVPVEGSIAVNDCRCRMGTMFEDGGCMLCTTKGLDCQAGGGGVLGERYVFLKPGFSSGAKISVYHCFGDEQRCPGGPPGDSCAKGRTGIACARCKYMMYSSKTGECTTCSSGDVAPFLVWSIVVILFLCCVYLVANYNPFRQHPAFSLVGICFGQIVSTIQQFGIILNFSIDLQDPLRGLFRFISLLCFDVEVFRLSCVFKNFDEMVVFLSKVSIIYFGAACLALLHLVSSLVSKVSFVTRDTKAMSRTLSGRRHVLVASIGTMAMMFYIAVIINVLAPLQCTQHPNGRWTMTMRSLQSVECWDHEGMSKHRRMVILSLAFLMGPLGFLASCIWAVWIYPMKTHAGDAIFLKQFGFLFFRCHPEKHWFILVMVFRSLMVGIVPSVPDPVLQLGGMQMILMIYLGIVTFHLPWRIKVANFTDACLTVLTIVVVNSCAFFTETKNTSALGWACIFLMIVVTLVLVGICSKRIFDRCGPVRKPYQFFLCHYKANAGAFARLLKFLLAAHRKVVGKVFLDSDDLQNLCTLFDTVRASTENLLLINSKGVLTRPWCLGELVTASTNGIVVRILAMQNHDVISEEYIISITNDIMSPTHFLAKSGISKDMVETMLRKIPSFPSITFPTHFRQHAISVLADLIVEEKHGEDLLDILTSSRPVDGILTNIERIILTDESNSEAVSSALIMAIFLSRLADDVRQLSQLQMHLSSATVPSGVKLVIVICSTGCFLQVPMLHIIEQIAAHELIQGFPVVIDESFKFPTRGTEDLWLAQTFVDNFAVVSCVVAIFAEIAPTFYASHSSDALLALMAKSIHMRIAQMADTSGSMRTISGRRPSDETENTHSAASSAKSPKLDSSGMSAKSFKSATSEDSRFAIVFDDYDYQVIV